MSKLRQRLQKMGSLNNSIEKGRSELSDAIDTVLENVIKEAAKEIRVPYDEGIFTLVINNSKYMDIKNDLDTILGSIEGIAEQWQKDTIKNYDDQIKND